MKIAVYVDLFDPITNWEMDVVKKLEKKFDLVLLAPLCSPLLKEITSGFEKRISNLKMAIENLGDNVAIVQSDDPNAGMACTHHIMNGVKGEFPDDELHMVITEHLVETIPHWQNIEALKDVSVINIVGSKKVRNHDNVVEYNVKYLDLGDEPFLWEKHTNRPSLCFEGQFDYMIDSGMNLYHFLSKYMSEKFMKHSFNTLKNAEKLAMRYNPKLVKKARIAGLLHDIARTFNKNELLGWISDKEKRDPEALWHAPAGANILKANLLIEDKEILNAIKKHTKASKKMSELDMIVFCADNLDPLKKELASEFEKSGDVEWLVDHIDSFTLEEVFIKCLRGLKNNLIENRIKQCDESHKIFKKWNA